MIYHRVKKACTMVLNCDLSFSSRLIRTIALLIAMGRDGRGDRPTEIVLSMAFGESGTAKRGPNRLMRWQCGEMSGHDLAREPGLGEQRDYRLGEMPLPVPGTATRSLFLGQRD